LEVASAVALDVASAVVQALTEVVQALTEVVQALTEVEAMAAPAVSDLVRSALLAVSAVVEVAPGARCPTWDAGRAITSRRPPISTWEPAVILPGRGEISLA